MTEFILEFLKELHNKGVSWGAILTALLLWSKMQRNRRFQERDERVERNQRRIMEHWGIEGEWSTPPKTLKQRVLMSSNKLCPLLRKEIQLVFQKRRVKRMQNINYVTLIGALLGAAKLVLQAFGVEIPDEQINEITNGAAALASVIGVLLSHRKEQTHVDAPSATNDGPAV